MRIYFSAAKIPNCHVSMVRQYFCSPMQSSFAIVFYALTGDGPNTPNVVTSTDVNNQGVMDEGGQFHDDHNRELEYTLFEEQSYVSGVVLVS